MVGPRAAMDADHIREYSLSSTFSKASSMAKESKFSSEAEGIGYNSCSRSDDDD